MGKLINMDDILFTKEAAEYLNISVQRLHVLVKNKMLIPLKKSPSGMLFSIESLENRKRALEGFNELNLDNNESPIDLNTTFMQEVLNYYTVQSFNNYSDKKTQLVLKKTEIKVDLEKPIKEIIESLSNLLELSNEIIFERYEKVYNSFKTLSSDVLIIKKGSSDYPKLLEITEEAPPFLFVRGNVDLFRTNIVSVVGSRKATKEGLTKAYQLSILLGRRGVTIASGLARGIDTSALLGAIENGYNCVAVIGTPINKYYPKENKELQEYIAKNGLLVSQFPPSSTTKRWNFPLRNSVMSGVSLATAIVEASETSGALKQADYALKQKRIVFIPTSAVENDSLSWPKRYLKRNGANQFTKINELLTVLENHEVLKEKVTTKAGNKNHQIDIFSYENPSLDDPIDSNRKSSSNVFKYE